MTSETPEAFGIRLARRDWPEGQTRSDLQGEVMLRYDISDPAGDAALDAYDAEWNRLEITKSRRAEER